MAEGTAAWLDIKSTMGKVRNQLEQRGGPAEGQPVVRLTAKTSMGDIQVRRGTTS